MSDGLFSQLADLIRLVVLFGTLTVVVFLELKTGRVHNAVTIPAIVIGLVANSFFGGLAGLKWALVGSLIGFAIYFFFYLVGLMLNYKFLGGGDVKLIAAVGAITGLGFTLRVIYWTILTAAVMGIYTLIRNRALLKGLVRSLRIFFLMPPDPRDEEAIAEGGVRYSLAIAIGTLLAFAQMFLLQTRGFA